MELPSWYFLSPVPATDGGNFGINVGAWEFRIAVDGGGLLERVLRLGARTLRTEGARVDLMDADARRSNTAIGRPFDVMTTSSGRTDLSHCFAGFFFRSPIEIVLITGNWPTVCGHSNKNRSADSLILKR